MKKIIMETVLLFICIIFIFSMFIFSACGNEITNVYKINEYSSYKSLGVASLESSKNSKKNFNTNARFIGVNQYNTVQEINFSDSKNDILYQNKYLAYYDDFERFVILTYSDSKKEEFNGSLLETVKNSEENANTYSKEAINIQKSKKQRIKIKISEEDKEFSMLLCDKQTGLIYNVNNIFKEIKTKDICIFNLNSNENEIYFYAFDEKEIKGVYKLKIEESGVKIQTLIELKQIENIKIKSEDKRFFQIDRYGNMIFGAESFEQDDKILKKDGKFSWIELEKNQDCYLAVNGIVYKSEYDNINTKDRKMIKRWYLNQEGNFEEIDLNCQIEKKYSIDMENQKVFLTNKKEYSEKTVLEFCESLVGGNNKIQIKLNSISMTNEPQSKVKKYESVILELEENLKINNQSVENYKKQFNTSILFDDVIYVVFNGKTYCFSSMNGEKLNLLNNYEILTFQINKLQNVLQFCGVDKTTLSDVKGYIFNNIVNVGEFRYDVKGASQVFVINDI